MTPFSRSGRRDFLKQSALVTGGLGLGAIPALSNQPATKHKNSIPQWKGFNVQDFFSPNPKRARRATTEEELMWMRDWGFDFLRIPMAYPAYLDIDHRKPIVADDVYKVSEGALEKVDRLVELAHKYSLHVSLNLHRAPG
jgi:aryl-phospho-beta-D-glucosidase BglC (GH1 family)